MSGLLDTHAIIWFLLRSPELSPTGLDFIRNALRSRNRLYISAISIIEIIYLTERGRILPQALPMLHSYLNNPASGFVVAPVDANVARALQKISRDLVPDMPDRIIAATSVHLGLPLLTCDKKIQSAIPTSIW
jgi:PIN domain nuclease of toxin-antitoxin system